MVGDVTGDVSGDMVGNITNGGGVNGYLLRSQRFIRYVGSTRLEVRTTHP